MKNMKFKRITFVTCDRHVYYLEEFADIEKLNKDKSFTNLIFPELIPWQDDNPAPIVHPDNLVEKMDKILQDGNSYLICSLSAVVFDTIRRYIAITGKCDDVICYYITKDGCKEFTVNEYGACPDWPKDMFETEIRLSEEILTIASRKSKEKREARKTCNLKE